MSLWKPCASVAVLGALGYLVVSAIIANGRAECSSKGGVYICGEHRCFCFAAGVVLP